MATLRGVILSSPGHADACLQTNRKFAEELSVSLTTLMKVYDQFRSEGFITAQTGNSTFLVNHLPHLSSSTVRIAENHQPASAVVPFSSIFRIERYFLIGFGRAILNALGGPQPQAFWYFLIHLAGIR